MAEPFEHVVHVRWRDTDALGHVNHAVFLTYLEEGRDAFYVHALGSDPYYVVARLEVDLRAEVRHPDRQVRVRIQAERLGTTSLTTRETVLTPSGEIAADARVVTVRWDPGNRKPVPFSEAERSRLAAMAGLPNGRADPRKQTPPFVRNNKDLSSEAAGNGRAGGGSGAAVGLTRPGRRGPGASVINTLLTTMC
ncbi:MAG: acyl-CoA thioesterase [Streptosporangiaceae bacterium]|nr:acyl-CoA thioesterase [Streptosporangiaceae bacterium]